jgi:hypothetical protein
MPLENWIQHSRLDQFLYDWQTVIAGVLAFVAGFGTVVAAIWAIWATRSTAREQIAASGEDARKVIAATREQTETTVRLEHTRNANEASAFYAMLAEAMKRVIAEAAWAEEAHPEKLALKAGSSPEGFTVRQCITKGAFGELRAACVRQGSPLTGEFLNLEREIDNFALQWEYNPPKTEDALIPLGKHAGMREQLSVIKDKATELGKKAVEA